jgi:hypothetical protein
MSRAVPDRRLKAYGSEIEGLRAKRLYHQCVAEEYLKAEIRWQLSEARPLQVPPAWSQAPPQRAN